MVLERASITRLSRTSVQFWSCCRKFARPNHRPLSIALIVQPCRTSSVQNVLLSAKMAAVQPEPLPENPGENDVKPAADSLHDVVPAKAIASAEPEKDGDLVRAAQIKSTNKNFPMRTPKSHWNNPQKQKKVAILMGYSGHGFAGMQWNPNVETIEGQLFKAMAKLDLIRPDFATEIQQLSFQRCARTDKGVSAAGQVISIPLAEPFDDVIEKVNAELPSSIRLFGVKRTTRGFNSKTWCSARTYLYMTPTLAFAPLEATVTYDYRIEPERAKKIDEYLQIYKGTKNFHNFTIGVKAWQDAAKRYMKELSCGEPFVRDGIEFVVVSIRGQSFMMHQIRKMMGLIIAVMRGIVPESVFETAFSPAKVDIPRAPGLGLLLQAVHFDMYDQKFQKSHDALVWPECKDAVEKFKEEHIFPSIIRGEKEDKSMLIWLADLVNHVFGDRDPTKEKGKTHTVFGNISCGLAKAREDAEAESDEALADDSDAEAEPASKKIRTDE